MSDLSLEVNEMLDAGYLPVTVAKMLEIPVNWVYESDDLDNNDDLKTVLELP